MESDKIVDPLTVGVYRLLKKNDFTGAP